MKKNAQYEFSRYADIKRLHFILDAIRKNIGDNGTVLDVGCGNGVISRFIGSHGYNVLGVDVSDKTIAKASALNKLSNVQFMVKSAEALTAEGKTYDVVICSEVLEHLSEPTKLLTVLHEAIKDNGILVVTVPNGMGPREVLVTKPVINMQKKQNATWRFTNRVKKLLGYSGTTTQSSADNLDHIQFFTQKDLEKMAAETGFAITAFGNSNFIDDVFPFSLVTKKSGLLQKVDGKLADYLPHALAGGFFTVWKKQSAA